MRTQNLVKPTSVRRDWGGVLGGPIVKNKAHFFVSYNYTELRRVSQVNQNGTLTFNTDLPFDATNPKTQPRGLR